MFRRIVAAALRMQVKTEALRLQQMDVRHHEVSGETMGTMPTAMGSTVVLHRRVVDVAMLGITLRLRRESSTDLLEVLLKVRLGQLTSSMARTNQKS